MCGIIGYIGSEIAEGKLIKGLKALEYRGYDSCGIATSNQITKTKGRVINLEDILKNDDTSTIGIGHTRWATHGIANETNAHPHKVGKITLVHNGIIENYMEIKLKLQTQGIKFVSETDTEVACALINYYFTKCGDIVASILKAKNDLVGSYAFAIMVEGDDAMYATRYKSPLLLGKSQGGNYLASDLSALSLFASEFYNLNENEIAVISKDKITLENSKLSTPVWEILNVSFGNTTKQGYDHYMLKEIYEQSRAIKNTVENRIKLSLPTFENDGIADIYFRDFDSIHIIGCGSAMHAGLIGKSIIEKYASVPTYVYVASEYRYNPPIARGNPLCIFISQSGETADTYASLEYAKSKGYKTLSIVNKQYTKIATDSDNVIYTYAGDEIAVATTKGYTTQISVLILLALKIALEKSTLDAENAKKLTLSLFSDVPNVIEKTLSDRHKIKEVAKVIYQKNELFYIGRGLDYDLCKECSLKLKEISYITSQDYQAGELKHGTISLITEKTPVIAIANNKELLPKTISNLKETKARGANTILITPFTPPNESCDILIKIKANNLIESIFATVLTIQLLAYEVACLRDCDIDKPRNLAKSVTVE
jgi:glucosamine--fructose-6-phosphate aminotransferase (isomerizing)